MRRGARMFTGSAVVSGGTAIFYLTDNNLIGGNAFFNNVYKSSANFWVESNTTQHQIGSYSLSVDKKTLTVNVTALTNVLLGIIQISSASNGTTVYLTIWGD